MMNKQVFIHENHAIKYVYLDGHHQETLCFIHGAGSHFEQFNEQIDVFKPTFNILLVNLYGHDPEDQTLDLKTSDFTISRLALDISHLIKHLDIKNIHLIGHSAGGLVALEIIKSKTLNPKSLVTFGTAVRLNVSDFIAKTVSKIDAFMLKRKPESYIKFLVNASTKHEPVKPLITKIMLEAKQAAPHIRRHIGKYDYVDVIKDMNIDYLLIEGVRDKEIIKANKPHIKKLINHSNIKNQKIIDAGHFTNMDQPEAFNQMLMEFYQSLDHQIT